MCYKWLEWRLGIDIDDALTFYVRPFRVLFYLCVMIRLLRYSLFPRLICPCDTSRLAKLRTGACASVFLLLL